jgi:hypothetical protein
MTDKVPETKPLSLGEAESLCEALKIENQNWNVSFGLAPSFDPDEKDPSKQPYQIDTWFNIRTVRSYDVVVQTRDVIQQKAQELFGHRLNDDAISVRPIQVPDVRRAGTPGGAR